MLILIPFQDMQLQLTDNLAYEYKGDLCQLIRIFKSCKLGSGSGQTNGMLKKDAHA